MREFQSKRAYKPDPKHQESGFGVSITVPNEAYSIRELLERFGKQDMMYSNLYGDGSNDMNHDDLDAMKATSVDLLTDLEEARLDVRRKATDLKAAQAAIQSREAAKSARYKEERHDEGEERSDDAEARSGYDNPGGQGAGGSGGAPAGPRAGRSSRKPREGFPSTEE